MVEMKISVNILNLVRGGTFSEYVSLLPELKRWAGGVYSTMLALLTELFLFLFLFESLY